ncbi:MAG: hypothetical protein GY754_13030 [bacterium]|nr:hypothetical protein [bacterium]
MEYIRKYILGLLFAVGCLMFSSQVLFAGTTLSNTGTMEPDGISSAAAQVQAVSDSFGPAMANAYGLGNVGGYPIGTPILEPGDFFLGLSINSGMTNMKYFDDSFQKPQGYYPAFGANPAVYLGIGLGGDIDILAKVMIYTDSIYSPPLSFSYASLSKLKIYSAGGKFRYNYIKKKPLLPGLFDFGGVTFSLGGDFMYGELGLEGAFDYPLGSIDVDPTGSNPMTLALDFSPGYTAEVSWFIVGANFQAITYFDVFWIFDLYMGLGMLFTYGSFDLNINGQGQVTTDNDTYKLNNSGSGEIANLILTSTNSYNPTMLLPLFIIGLDIDLFIMRISVESMVNMWNREDINMQIGTRIQF